MNLLFTCVLPGRPIVKKNTKRFFGRGRMTYSKNWLVYEKAAMPLLIAALVQRIGCIPVIRLFPIHDQLEAHFKFYFKNHQGEADVSNLIEGPQDLLQKAGVISNDKIIQKVVAEKFFGCEARTEISLYKYEVGI